MPDNKAQEGSQNNVVIRCPQCGKILQFKPFPNYQKAKLSCPFCKFHDSIENYPPATIARKQPPTPPTPHDDTIPLNPATIRCLDTGVSHPLELGKNTIGRSCAAPQASITFDDAQKYLSRVHATIDVVDTGAHGLQIRLSDNGSKNGTFVNGKRLTPSAIVVVAPGSVISMGRFRFEVVLDNKQTPQQPFNNGSGPSTVLI